MRPRHCLAFPCLIAGAVLFCLLAAGIARAEHASVTSDPSAYLGGTLTLRVDKFDTWGDIDKIHKLESATLVLDGQRMEGLSPRVDVLAKALHYRLEGTKAKAAWGAVLGGHLFVGHRQMPVTIGFDDGHLLRPGTVDFVVIRHPVVAAICAVMLLAAVVGFVVLLQRSDILRDRSVQPVPGRRRPYSLAWTQLAVWFFVILGSYLLIYVIRQEWPAMPGSVLAILGIATGTTVGAKMVDSTKAGSAADELQKLRADQASLTSRIQSLRPLIGTPQATPPITQELDEKQHQLLQVQARINQIERATRVASDDFITDLLTDASGVSLHRFQMVVWTVVLAAMFLITVVQQLAMPEIDATLLGLMGVSAGTYVGLKVPEKHA